GFRTIEIGLLGSAYYSGFVLGCLGGPFLILRAGHIRAYGAMVAIACAVALVHALTVDPAVWIPSRVVTGLCVAGLFLTIESWLNDRATNQNRGFVLSAYVGLTFVAITCGQLLVMTGSPAGFSLFAVTAILISLATIPVALTRSAQPAPIARAA